MKTEQQLKHTPGPWVPRGSHLCADFGIVIDDAFVIAEVFSDIRQKAKTDVEEARANARLIAAAPNLLAALQGVLRVADRSTDEFDAARAAISKATGSPL